MILNVKEENLAFLFSLSAPATEDFGKVMVDYVSKGPNQKLFTSLGQKLAVSKETIQSSIEELAYLFIESYKRKLSGPDFRDFASKTGFSKEQADALTGIFEEQQSFLTEILQEQSKSQLPHFSGLDWRFESQIASRSLLHQNDPSILVKVQTSSSGITQNHFVQMEPTVLLSVTDKLKDALKESNSVMSKRVLKKFSLAK